MRRPQTFSPSSGGRAATHMPPASAGVEQTLRDLGGRLRQLRLEQGLRLADIAAASGISEPHLSRIEAGDRWPSLPSLLVLAEAYGVEPGALLKERAAVEADALHGAGAVWVGSEEHGSGRMSGGGCKVEYNLKSRLTSTLERDDAMSSPEELIGMAFAGCFSMSLAESLTAAGFAPDKVATEAEVVLRTSETDVAIAAIHLVCRTDADGIPLDRFEEIAQMTKRSCVVARALAAVPVTLEAHLNEPALGPTTRRRRRGATHPTQS